MAQRHARAAGALDTVDPVWARIRNEAEEAVRHEPELQNIRAREVIIFGSARGNIEAVEKLAIRDQGSLVGDIKTAGISIDDGAYFKGSIDISRPEPKVSSKPVKTEARAAL